MPVLGAAAGGGGKSVLQTISFINSTTWSPAQDMNAKIYVIGAGGSGGVAAYNATGGGAGGCAVTIIDLDASTTYTITIGAPGKARDQSSTGANGYTGGNTTFAGSGISTMTGSGGGGGLYNTAGNGTGTANGGSGGAASGGTYGNFTGGAGGAITADSINAYYKATGGGAVGLWATGTAAPTVTGGTNNTTAGYFHNNGGYTMGAASGASVGGTYLNFRVDDDDTIYSDLIRTPAGGLLSLSSMGGSTHVESINYEFNWDQSSVHGALPAGLGGPPIFNNGNQSIQNIQAGAFAGGGPVLSSTSSSYWGLGGSGGIGGGGGAGLGMGQQANNMAIAGQGGIGCVLIEVLEYK